jgi:hypothetical protein
VQIRIEASDLPGNSCGPSPDCPGGYHNIHVGVLYLSWGTVDNAKSFTLFRRAKLWLDAIPPTVINGALDLGLLVGRLGLTDRKGNPLCAAVRPPVIEWSAVAAE